MKRTSILVGIFLVLSATAAHAQTNPCPPQEATPTLIRVAGGQSFDLSWNDANGDTTKYSLFVDGTIVKHFAGSEIISTPLFGSMGCFTKTVSVDGQVPGEHQIKVRAYVGDDPTKDFTDSVTYNLRVLPFAPSNLRVVISPSSDPNAPGIVVEMRGAELDGVTPSSTMVLRFPTVEKK